MEIPGILVILPIIWALAESYILLYKRGEKIFVNQLFSLAALCAIILYASYYLLYPIIYSLSIVTKYNISPEILQIGLIFFADFLSIYFLRNKFPQYLSGSKNTLNTLTVKTIAYAITLFVIEIIVLMMFSLWAILTV